MKKISTVVLVIIGTIIGAGFASGQEIYSFFFKYEFNGLIGIIVASFLLTITCFMVFRLINADKIESYEEFLKVICKTTNSNNKNIYLFLKIIVNLFLLISFYIMIAGFGAYFNQELNITPIFGSILVSILCFIAFKNNIEGVIKVNTILTPILIIAIIYLGIINNYTNIPPSYRSKYKFTTK